MMSAGMLCFIMLLLFFLHLQVAHALELYKEAGVPTRSFVGVPVFQAEGLTVTTQEMVKGCAGVDLLHACWSSRSDNAKQRKTAI